MKKEFKVISQIIQSNKRVLDIGCGDGTLMEYLKINQQNDVRGLEPKKKLVQTCIAKGLSVIEGDAGKIILDDPWMPGKDGGPYNAKIRIIKNTEEEIRESDKRDPAPVDMTPWVKAKEASLAIVGATVAIYLFLSWASL